MFRDKQAALAKDVSTPEAPQPTKGGRGRLAVGRKKRQVRNNRVGVMGSYGLVRFEHIRSTLIFLFQCCCEMAQMALVLEESKEETRVLKACDA